MNRPRLLQGEELAEQFQVSIQTIRLDRMELGIPEVRKRIESVAQENWDETLKALPADEVIGEVIDLELDQSAISILRYPSGACFFKKPYCPWTPFIRTG